MNGLVGGLSGKNSSGSSRDDQLLVLKYVSNLLQKYITPQNNVDFFIFSWHTDFMDEFNHDIKWAITCTIMPCLIRKVI